MGHALIEAILRAAPDRLAMLRAVGSCVPDGWLAAGAIRNPVWDHLHGGRTALNDSDVIRFRPDANACDDARLETALCARLPGVAWSVRNQARMHERNGHPPYRDCADAMRHWPETATAIAARLGGETIELLAPLGVDDLLALTIRRAPAADPAVYAARLRSKNWQHRWARLTIMR